MEIKAVLKKPYTDLERTSFIVNYNHNMGFEIRENNGCIEAWGYTEEEIFLQERERVNGLKCTKRVFALMLQQMGVDYLTQLKPLIESNPQAQLEWELCVELERGNPLLDIMSGQLGISSEKLDAIFKLANNEMTQEEFIQAITPQEEIQEEQEIEEVVE